MRRLTIPIAAGVLLALGIATPAAGHAGLMPGEYAPGTTTASQVVIVHGCGPGGTIPTGSSQGSPTGAVTVTVPEGIDIEAASSTEWEVTRDGPELRFTSTDPAGVAGTASIDVSVRVPDGAEERDLWIPAVQECTDGEQLRWTFEGVEVGSEFAAMRTTIDRYAGMTPAEIELAERPSPWLPVAGIVGLALLAGGAVFVASGRRG